MASQKLTKQLSQLNVWALAFGCVIGWGAFIMPGTTFLPQAGPLGTAIAMGAGALIMLVISVNYNYMIQKYPYSGGEFIYALNVLGKRHGFVCAWFLTLSYLCIVPLNATALSLISHNLLNDVLRFGSPYTFAGYTVYTGEVLVSSAVLALFWQLSVRGVKLTAFFQTIFALLIIAGITLVTAAMVWQTPLNYIGGGILFSPEMPPMTGICAAISVAPWAFVGFDTIPQSCEEFDFHPSKCTFLFVAAIVAGACTYCLLTLVAATCIPPEFANWPQYISAADTAQGLAALPVFWAARQLLGDGGLVVITIAVCSAILTGILGFYMATSRLLYAISRENMLSSIFSGLHPRHNTPAKALTFVFIVSLLLSLLGRRALGWIVDMSAIGAAIGYGYTSASALILARQHGHLGVCCCGILGLLFSLGFCVLLLVPLPGVNVALGPESYICLFIWSCIGIFWYWRHA